MRTRFFALLLLLLLQVYVMPITIAIPVAAILTATGNKSPEKKLSYKQVNLADKQLINLIAYEKYQQDTFID